MIVKAVSHKQGSLASIQKLIDYVFDKAKMQDRYYGREALISKRYVRGYDKEGWAKALFENDQKRTYQHSKRTVLRHEIVSFAPQSNPLLNRDKLKAFADYYLKHRSPRSLGVCAVHYDQSPHLHFILSGTGIDGRSTRITRKEFKEFKIRFQDFQKKQFPELSHSLVNHSKKKCCPKTDPTGGADEGSWSRF